MFGNQHSYKYLQVIHDLQVQYTHVLGWGEAEGFDLLVVVIFSEKYGILYYRTWQVLSAQEFGLHLYIYGKHIKRNTGIHEISSYFHKSQVPNEISVSILV